MLPPPKKKYRFHNENHRENIPKISQKSPAAKSPEEVHVEVSSVGRCAESSISERLCDEDERRGKSNPEIMDILPPLPLGEGQGGEGIKCFKVRKLVRAKAHIFFKLKSTP